MIEKNQVWVRQIDMHEFYVSWLGPTRLILTAIGGDEVISTDHEQLERAAARRKWVATGRYHMGVEI